MSGAVSLPSSPCSCRLSRMFKIFCEASKDMSSNCRIFFDEISGLNSRGDSNIFFIQQNKSGLVTTTIVYSQLLALYPGRLLM